jgi:hypothetical protein
MTEQDAKSASAGERLRWNSAKHVSVSLAGSIFRVVFEAGHSVKCPQMAEQGKPPAQRARDCLRTGNDARQIISAGARFAYKRARFCAYCAYVIYAGTWSLSGTKSMSDEAIRNPLRRCLLQKMSNRSVFRLLRHLQRLPKTSCLMRPPTRSRCL